MPEPAWFLRHRIMVLRGILRRENPTYTYWRGPTLQRGVVLKWFYSLSRRNIFVAGTCAPPSALLVRLAARTCTFHNFRKLATLKWCVSSVFHIPGDDKQGNNNNNIKLCGNLLHRFIAQGRGPSWP